MNECMHKLEINFLKRESNNNYAEQITIEYCRKCGVMTLKYWYWDKIKDIETLKETLITDEIQKEIYLKLQ